MSPWQFLADSAGLVAAVVVGYALLLVVRRRWLARSGGTFEFSIRVRSGMAGRGWILGLGRYSGENLEWFRIFSLAPRPKRVLRRSDLEYTGRRDPGGVESYTLYAGHVVVSCRTPSGPLEVAMSPGALTGFLAWLEAAPPGQVLRRR